MNFYQWTGSPEILRVKPNGDFELANGVDPLVALGQLSKAFIKQQDRIKRLEDAGGQLLMWLGEDISDSNLKLLEGAWRKAKEDKP